MPLVFVIGSHVAGSRVGGTVVSLCLAMSPWKIDPVHVPTTLLGRHPGWGPPGGAAVSAETMAGIFQGVRANGLVALADAVLTDYFAVPEQVVTAARVIDAVRSANRSAHILVDPVMGDFDAGGAYVSEAVQAAIIEHLVPRATIMTPNLWELGRLTGGEITGRIAAFDSAKALAARMASPQAEVLITSLPAVPGLTGIGLVADDVQSSIRHSQFESAPRGAGDLTAAAYLACRIGGLTPVESLNRSGRYVHKVLANAQAWSAPELPVVASQHCWQEAGHE